LATTSTLFVAIATAANSRVNTPTARTETTNATVWLEPVAVQDR
jgi:hypothetical protein